MGTLIPYLYMLVVHSEALLCLVNDLKGTSCISSTIFYRIPSPKSASYCEALYTVGYVLSHNSKGKYCRHSEIVHIFILIFSRILSLLNTSL